MGGRYVPSLIAAIGEVIEGHMIRTGFLVPPQVAGKDDRAGSVPLAAGDDTRERPAGSRHQAGGRVCPRCSARALHRREGCWTCDSCGYSRCG